MAERAADKSSGRAAGLPRSGFLLLAALTLFWGLNWPAMKIALTEIPVWSFRTICVAGGGLGLLAILLATRRSIRVPRREIGPLLFCGSFTILAWMLLTGYGLTLIEAGRASIIAFTMPVWAAILSTLVLGERMTGRKLLALLVGVAGLAVLIGPDLVVFQEAPLGALFMLAAAVAWAIGTVATKAFHWSISTATLIGWQLIAAAVPIGLGTLLFEPPADWSAISARAYWAAAYTVALPMLFCQWAYISVVRLFPASIAALGTLAIPAVGVLSSALILGEPAGLRELVSLLLVSAALGLVLLVREAPKAS